MKRTLLFFVMLITLGVLISACPASPSSSSSSSSVSSASSSSKSSSSSSIPTTNYTSSNIGTLIYVPTGAFQYDGFSAADVCTISAAFHMSKYDITRAEYSNVMGIDPVVAGGETIYSTGTNDPVMYVNWYQALVFCNDLSIKEGLTPVYAITNTNGVLSPTPSSWGAIPTSDNATWDAVTANWSANGYRLPTEMEWMWAAMGATNDARNGDIVGGVNTGGYTKGYAGSTEVAGGQVNITNYAYTQNSSGPPSSTEAVGLLKPNELGLYDMSGNVWQWCWDAWDGSASFGTSPYTGSLTDPTGFSGQVWSSGFVRVMRGGSWFNGASDASFSCRGGGYPYGFYYFTGFRVVRS
jgi:formylglycine-generating enzyme required for sulfatase activity